MRKRFKSVVSIVLILSLVVSLFNAPVFAENKKSQEGWDVYQEFDEYAIGFKVTNDWSSGFNGEFTIVNLSNHDLSDWKLGFEFLHEIDNFWSANILNYDGNTYEVEGQNWNSVVKTGSTLTLGFGGTPGNVSDFPTNFSLDYYEKDLEANQESKHNVVTDGDIKYEFNVINDWDTGYNGEIAITNNGSSTIESWALSFEFEGLIDNCWDADIVLHEDNRYILKCLDWNSDIKSGETMKIGFSGEPGNIKTVPVNYALVNQIVQSVDGYDIGYNVTNDWGSAYNAEFVITNTGEDVIEDWMIEFDFESEIERFWTADIINHVDNHYVVKNAGYNANITTGSAITLGFSSLTANTGNIPKNIVLSEVIIQDTKFEDLVSINYDGLILDEGNYTLSETYTSLSGEVLEPEIVESLKIQVYDHKHLLIDEENISFTDAWFSREVGFIKGLNEVKFVVTTATGKTYEHSINIMVNSNDYIGKVEIDMNDEDQDGLWNYFEDYFGTDKLNSDSDNDGLNDFIELYSLGYDPLSNDSDKDGIVDFDEDEDSDGLSNGEEVVFNSNPVLEDSDSDKLNDNDEMQFGTNPNLKDTDGDGITDYEEYKLGLDMLVYNQPNEQLTKAFSAEELGINVEQMSYPTIEFTGDIDALLSLEVEALHFTPTLNPNMTGYMGAAFDFTCSGLMGTSSLTFTYNPELQNSDMINSPNFKPAIFYYNEETQELEKVQNQVWEGNTVTAEITHFSIYVLLDENSIQELYDRTVELDDAVYENNQIVFVLDSSGSMGSNDPNNIRGNLTKEFISVKGENDQCAIVGFDSYAREYTSGLTADVDELNAAVDSFVSRGAGGGTYIYRGLSKAKDIFDNNQSENTSQKVVFLLTDGYSSDTPSTTFLDGLANDGIKVYTVGMGNVSESYLKRIADLTGGEYYYATSSNSLDNVFIDFQNDLIGTDENNDLIADYYLYLMCTGDILTKTGVQVFEEADYDELQSSDDYDGDGLKNGEELSVEYFYGNPYVVVHSDPFHYDTDFDGYSDYDETHTLNTDPLIFNKLFASDDLSYIINDYNFESYIAADKYLSTNTGLLALQRYADIVLGGGELFLVDMYREELAEYVLYSFEETADDKFKEEYIGLYLDLLRATSDGLEIYGGHALKYDIIKTSNAIAERARYFKYIHHSATKEEILEGMYDIQRLHKLEQIGPDIAPYKDIRKFGKAAIGIGIFLEVISLGMENIEEFSEYRSALVLLGENLETLELIEDNGVPRLAKAAKQIREDIEDNYDITKTVRDDILGDALMPAANTYIGITIARLGTKGLIADLVLLFTSVILGDSLAVPLNNQMTTEIGKAIYLGSDTMALIQGTVKSSTGEYNIAIYDENVDTATTTLFQLIASKMFAEEKYLKYVQNNRFGLNDATFLYVEEDSEENAQNNISRLKDILETLK